jgi:metal-responsive CopG/Arc/MetJ family transcriptional regulator
MSDMKEYRISIRVEEKLQQLLTKVALSQKKAESEIVREALRSYLEKFSSDETCYDLAHELGIIGTVADLPEDLSSNPDYFEGFGKS